MGKRLWQTFVCFCGSNPYPPCLLQQRLTYVLAFWLLQPLSGCQVLKQCCNGRQIAATCCKLLQGRVTVVASSIRQPLPAGSVERYPAYKIRPFRCLAAVFSKSEVIRTPTDDFGDRHTNQLILRSFNKFNYFSYFSFHLFKIKLKYRME